MPAAAQEIFHLGVAQLAGRIAVGELTASQVVDAHVARIQQVNPGINALVAPRFEQARAEAAAADAAQAAGQPLGPLHGVPITLKECFHLAGTDSTMGVHALAGRPLGDDGILVRRLRAAGAIVLGKTNVPQLMILHECDNPLYGRTNNPCDAERGPGGSSGGEAAIVAVGGSALGLGTDLGGSIRQPAHSCGICGLMPTPGRLSHAGCSTSFPGMRAIPFQPGPLARKVADLELAMQVLCARPNELQTESDAPPAPPPDSSQVSLAGLRIACWVEDGYFRPSPAIGRAVHEAADALRQRGAVVESFVPPDVAEMMRIYLGILSADGMRTFKRILARSPRDWRIARLLRLGGIPGWARPLATRWLRATGRPRMADVVAHAGEIGTDAYWRLCEQLDQYVGRFMQRLDEGQYQAMLFPPHALPAMRHGATAWLLTAASASILPNVVGLPAGVVPITRVRPDEETAGRNLRDRGLRAAAETERGSAGLPIGVQVAARPWREDVVLAIMAALEAHFPPPHN